MLKSQPQQAHPGAPAVDMTQNGAYGPHDSPSSLIFFLCLRQCAHGFGLPWPPVCSQVTLWFLDTIANLLTYILLVQIQERKSRELSSFCQTKLFRRDQPWPGQLGQGWQLALRHQPGPSGPYFSRKQLRGLPAHPGGWHSHTGDPKHVSIQWPAPKVMSGNDS